MRIIVADSLVDFKFVYTSSSKSKKLKDVKKGNSSRNGRKKITAKIKPSNGILENSQEKKRARCFMYDETHQAKDHPRRKKLNGLVKKIEVESSKPSTVEVCECSMKIESTSPLPLRSSYRANVNSI